MYRAAHTLRRQLIQFPRASSRVRSLLPAAATRDWSATPGPGSVPLRTSSSVGSDLQSQARSPAAAASAHSYNVGADYDGFKLLAITPSTDFQLDAYHFRHQKTGADYIHLRRDDPENAFAVAFRTPPENSTGVAHILEHTTLCGSHKYPVRDPFMLLLRRSLKTFMNAMTGGDATWYPFSTQNAQDFKNLLSVYLDATFHPLLKETDFRQEGHRFEFEKASDPTSPLKIKGVVYNEMKGAMSDTHSLFAQSLQENLYPTTTYHHNSGGEPRDIPDLTYEQLKQFHRTHYHPSNAVFMSYGNLPPVLAEINSVISSFERDLKIAQTAVPLERRFTGPKQVDVTCPVDPMVPDPEKQTKVSIAYLAKTQLAPVSAKEDLATTDGASLTAEEQRAAEERNVEHLALQLIATLLTDSPMSPMYQALIDPNIGSGYAPATGFDPSAKEGLFAVGLSDIKDEDVATVEKIVHETLEKVAETGFPEERVEAVIYQIELSLKHVKQQYGILLLNFMLPYWVHHLNPVSRLNIGKSLEVIRQRLAEGPYFQQLIRKHFLDNPHRLTLVMRPDPEYTHKEAEKEKARIAAVESKLTDADRQRLVAEAATLKQLQDKPPSPDCLPTLVREDIAPFAERVDLSLLSSKQHSIPLYTTQQPTNGLGYIRALVENRRVPAELRPYLPLFATFLTEVASGKYDYRQLAHEIEMHTGGISADLQFWSSFTNLDEYQDVFTISSSALHRNLERMLDLLQGVVQQPNFQDLNRLETLLTNYAAEMAMSLQESGLSFARTDAASKILPVAALKEEMSGIKHVKFVGELAARVAQSEDGAPLQEVASKLQQIAKILLGGGFDRALAVADESSLPILTSGFQKRFTDKANKAVTEPLYQPIKGDVRTFYALPIQVNNVAMCVRTVPVAHEDSSKLLVAGELLTHLFLHREIREKGGAYGGGASYAADGLLSFSSYRDPNVLRTVETFHSSAEWLQRDSSFTKRDIDEMLLSLFSSIDAPTPPSNKGVREWLTQIPYEMRQRQRERLLAVTKQDIQEVADKYLSKARLESAPITVAGNGSKVPEGISKEHGWAVKQIDLGQEVSDEEAAGAQ